ncbi:MAG: YeiH family protein [Phycisphaerae bacterium]
MTGPSSSASNPLVAGPDRVGASYAALSMAAFTSLGSMEGLYDPIVEVAPADAVEKRPAIWPGYAAAGGVAAAAYALHYLPLVPFTVVRDSTIKHPISGAIIAILIGVAVRNLLPLPAAVFSGCRHIIKKIIPLAIVLIGAGLNLTQLASIGPRALFITIVCMGVAIGVAYYCGRALGLGTKVSLLIGAGTGVCGNSAIAAVAPLIDADDQDLVLSIGTINLFGLAAMLACPLIGGLLHLDGQAFGVWAGTSIHAVPQVVAAGFALSPDAGELATLVKLVRVALMAPMVFVLALIYARKHVAASAGRNQVIVHYARFVPWFVWGFVGMAVLGTLGLVPTLHFDPAGLLAGAAGPEGLSLVELSTRGGKILLTLAMAAIGLEVNVRLLAGVSSRAVLTGLVASVLLAGVSLGLIRLILQ